MGLWQAENSMSNQAIIAWMKSLRRTLMVYSFVKARSATVTVYRSNVMTAAGSVATALMSTVSTSGSVSAVRLRGV